MTTRPYLIWCPLLQDYTFQKCPQQYFQSHLLFWNGISLLSQQKESNCHPLESELVLMTHGITQTMGQQQHWGPTFTYRAEEVLELSCPAVRIQATYMRDPVSQWSPWSLPVIPAQNADRWATMSSHEQCPIELSVWWKCCVCAIQDVSH